MAVSEVVLGILAGIQDDPSPVVLPPAGLQEKPPQPPGVPTSLDELTDAVTRAYDLSVSQATELDIPVAGSVGGGYKRRVVLLERSAFKELEDADTTYRYGYAIRLAITVSDLSSRMKLSLPFLAASAEIGQIEGRWMLQVVGLSGPKIDGALLPPKELSVETFVLASQSMEKLIKAVRDRNTRFTARVVAVQKPADRIEREYRVAAGRAFALGRIEKGRGLRRAMDELDAPSDTLRDAITDAYREFGGLMNPEESPADPVRRRAREILEDIKVEPR